MAYLPSSNKEIALTGANIVIDASHMLPASAKEIILASRSAGGHVTVLNACKYLPATSKELALAGGKQVTLHLTD